MSFQFSNAVWLWVFPPALAMVIWFAWKSDVQTSPWRRWVSFLLRLTVVSALILAISGIQWRKPLEGMNVFFALDRSDSIPATQQEMARKFINEISKKKEKTDRVGILVFGADAAIETSPNPVVDVQKIQAVVGTERTDLAAAIRLGTAAFPETGQKRLVILSDGNENVGDAVSAMLATKPLGVSVDVLPLGVAHGQDVSVQRLALPNSLKKSQTFEAKIFLQADKAQSASVRLYRNDQLLGEQKVELSAGKNLFSFPQTLNEPGFYKYDVQVDAPGDMVPQNNRATSFTTVRGDPTLLLVSADPEEDKLLASALSSAQLGVKVVGIDGFPTTLAELQSYDAIMLSNVAAGDLGTDMMRLLESAVRDFGTGLICVGGDQTYGAGGYRGTPLEAALPVDMELNSKKVLPKGALVLIMHGMEFANGNQIARDIGIGALEALGPQDELGVVLWDGNEHWLFPLTEVGDRRELGHKIQGMNQGDLPSFQNVMVMGYEGLKKSTANLKHMVVFSDGDPGAPTDALLQSMAADKITVSTVLISGHAGPQTMISIADKGHGRFYDVQNAAMLPQIFIKEAAVILKSAIFESPFKPQLTASSELVRGINASEYPQLLGYVCTTPKSRAETPLVSDKGDPILAHWQYGLGRAVAFTSDAKAKWAKNWLGWGKYQQFWSQIAKWSLRRLENSDFTTEVSVEKGEGVITVDALDPDGNFRNFLTLETVVIGPHGNPQNVRLDQTGPGHYEAHFPTKDVGAYVLNLMDMKDGKLRGSQVLGASVNYSPEFNATEPNLSLLQRLAEIGGGRILNSDDPAENPFGHQREKTFQPRDLWESLLKLAILLFTIDVGVRRIQIDRDEWNRATQNLRRWIFFWRGAPRPVEVEDSLNALLARREQVRTVKTAAGVEPRSDLFRPQNPTPEAAPEKPFFAPTSPASGGQPEGPAPETPAKTPSESTTASRLLDAKRRAQKRKP